MAMKSSFIVVTVAKSFTFKITLAMNLFQMIIHHTEKQN